MFIGREKELKLLNDAYLNKKAQLVILYGRRRIGKTELITQFCKDKRTLFYSANESKKVEQLMLFTNEVKKSANGKFDYVTSFSSFQDGFEAVSNLCDENERLVFVIDEFPYLVKSDNAVTSIIQNLWDRTFKDKNVMIILSGSSISFIEDELLAEKKPLYGRASIIYKLGPLTIKDCFKYFKNYSTEDKILSYSITGGIPLYLKEFDPNLNLKTNICNKILKRGTLLYNEVEFLLKQEFKQPSTYNSIVKSIVNGNSTYTNISNDTNIDPRILDTYLKKLEDIQIISKIEPSNVKLDKSYKKGKSIYQITDGLFKFWYKFCYPYFSQLERIDPLQFYSIFVANNLHDYGSKTFEDICIEYLYKVNSERKLNSFYISFENYWGSVNSNKINQSIEIDILANDLNFENYLIGECKFTNKKMGLVDLNKLKEKLMIQKSIEIYLFSLYGFNDDLLSVNNIENNIKLVDGDSLVSELTR